MHAQEVMIQRSAAVKCLKMDILLQQITGFAAVKCLKMDILLQQITGSAAVKCLKMDILLQQITGFAAFLLMLHWVSQRGPVFNNNMLKTAVWCHLTEMQIKEIKNE